MAFDTRDKSSSAMFPLLPWRCTLPIAEGALNQDDSPHICLLYSGLFPDALIGQFICIATTSDVADSSVTVDCA